MGVKAGRLSFMSGALQLGPVGEVRIGLTFASAIEAPPHDTFLLDLHPDVSADPFDERPYLAAVASLVSPAGAAPPPGVVHVNRTQAVGTDRAGEADIVIALADGEEHALEPAAVDMARSALRSILTSHGAPQTRALGHDEALLEARRRVEASYPEAQAERLVVTDEEHMASQGMWSIGLALAPAARFEVLLGFVDGITQTTHIRRMPGTEVVDSVGTGGG